ncbi:MAG: addiction module antitoxin [Rhizobium sp.]|nr:addiction module antitoxin [Rhizobium sp.]
MKIGEMLPPIHPGEILREVHLADLNIEAGTLTKKLHVSTSLVEEILAETADIDAEMALRLGRFFRTTPELWLNMQKAYDLKITAIAIKEELEKIVEYDAD